MSKYTSEPGTLRMPKAVIKHGIAATKGKKSLYAPVVGYIEIPSNHEVIKHPFKHGSTLYEAYGEAFKKAEAAGWGDDYYFFFERGFITCHRPKPCSN